MMAEGEGELQRENKKEDGRRGERVAERENKKEDGRGEAKKRGGRWPLAHGCGFPNYFYFIIGLC